GEVREQLGQLAVLLHAREVARLHVADLVPDHARELVGAARGEQSAAVHVDVAPGQGEGVQGGVAHDAEAVGEGLRVEAGGELVAEGDRVAEHDGGVDQDDVLADLRVELRTDVALVLDVRRTEGAERVPAAPVVLDAGRRGRREQAGGGEGRTAPRRARAPAHSGGCQRRTG